MVTEVFNRIGESEISENPNFFRKRREDYEIPESSIKIESSSKPLTEAKKEFFKHLEDDSLTIDTCNKVNKEWKK